MASAAVLFGILSRGMRMSCVLVLGLMQVSGGVLTVACAWSGYHHWLSDHHSRRVCRALNHCGSLAQHNTLCGGTCVMMMMNDDVVEDL